MRAVSQEIPQLSITKISLKIVYLNFHPNFYGANELIVCSGVKVVNLNRYISAEICSSKCNRNVFNLKQKQKTLYCYVD